MITNNTSQNRYELSVDGHLAVADYVLEGTSLTINHVFVPQELRGKGVAAQVMEGVVADAKEQGLTIIPVCSYAESYMKRYSASSQ
ncbi:MAG: GNAT family N-acetyltransferase [Rickettsiales bacterium]